PVFGEATRRPGGVSRRSGGGGQAAFLGEAAAAASIRQVGDGGDYCRLSDEKFIFRMTVERHEFRHGGRHGGETEVDFAMKWKADDWRYAAGVIGKQSIREFGAAAHQRPDPERAGGCAGTAGRPGR